MSDLGHVEVGDQVRAAADGVGERLAVEPPHDAVHGVVVDLHGVVVGALCRPASRRDPGVHVVGGRLHALGEHVAEALAVDDVPEDALDGLAVAPLHLVAVGDRLVDDAELPKSPEPLQDGGDRGVVDALLVALHDHVVPEAARRSSAAPRRAADTARRR